MGDHDSEDELERVLREAEQKFQEAQDLNSRARALFPIDLSYEKRRLSELERTRLLQAYATAPRFRPAPRYRLSEISDLFVRQIEGHASFMPMTKELTPSPRKDSQRKLQSVANAFDKLVDALNGLESAPLGWLYATIADATGENPNLKAHPIRAMVEGGEARTFLNHLSNEIGPAVRVAAKTLPNQERDDPREGATYFLESQMYEHGLVFETTETSYAADCLRAMFDLAGFETDRVRYWLEKINGTPDDQRPWFALRKNHD